MGTSWNSEIGVNTARSMTRQIEHGNRVANHTGSSSGSDHGIRGKTHRYSSCFSKILPEASHQDLLEEANMRMWFQLSWKPWWEGQGAAFITHRADGSSMQDWAFCLESRSIPGQGPQVISCMNSVTQVDIMTGENILYLLFCFICPIQATPGSCGVLSANSASEEKKANTFPA